jgi:serine phosphatase RsbU (regulator of sigma subunit)
MANFFNMPLLHIFNTLTNIQYEIKNAEYQALTDIINSGNKDLNTALFSQISDLNSKYDAIKKQEEITKLQSENIKGMELLHAKDSELNDSKQAIVYFVLVILVFLILVFFVIRSNYLRKQTNKTLLQQKEIIESQKTEVEAQKHLVEEKQKEIIDSISYAKRLQEAILPPQAFINKHISNNFILYKPKDLVAGDFYWAESIGDLFFIAAADSTGHGVPGAMVSVVCSNALNRTVKEFGLTETGKILDKTRELVVETFEKSISDVKDGMDISLLCIDAKNKKITWSGANNALWYIQDNKLITIKPDKQPIGKTEKPSPFTTHEIEYKNSTTFYLFTDGFADQFGGEKGKKFKYKQLEELLLSNNNLALSEQSNLLNQKFESWKGNLEQVDDVCVIGVKI